MVWHSSLTEKNKQDLERIQKNAFRIILKHNYNSYEQARKVLKMQSSDERRTMLCLRFAQNCLKDKKQKMFEIDNNNLSMELRKKGKFKSSRSRTERHKKSVNNVENSISSQDTNFNTVTQSHG